MIKTEKLTKLFLTDEMETAALNEINIHIKKGEFVSIMGPSGCGKSTMLNILGLLDNPNSGKYYFDGVDVSDFKERQRTQLRKGNIGFVFQSFNLIDELTLQQNIELPLIALKKSASERKDAVQSVMERLQIAHRAKHYPHQLSGGQQQRIAVARAIITNPKMILADEPTGNLDQKTAETVFDLMLKINHENNTALVIVTHDEKIAAKTDKVLTLNNGNFFALT